MKSRSTRTIVTKKKGGYLLVIPALIAALLFIPAGTSRAQESTPSVTAASETLSNNTTTPTVAVVETGTMVIPPMEAISTYDSKPLSADSTQVLVTITSKARILSVMDRLENYGNVTEIPELTKLGVFIIDISSENLDERIAQLQGLTGVQYVEQDHPVWATDTIPNDTGFVNQYGLNSIRAPQGWDLSTGSSAITIAILDSGVDFGHVDLAGKLVAGYDFVNADSNPQDDYGHGTHVAGIAAASGNNGVGIAGVSWGAQIMPVKVLNSLGNGSYSQVAAGIVWAVDHGAQVINMSLGGVGAPPGALHSAILYAYNNNVLLVASSGNTGSNFVLYPARYPEVMAVGGSNMSDQPSGFSNYGPQVDVAAPGENIYSLWPGSYSTQSGTSMSAAHVSGLAAILYGYANNAGTVRNLIESTALDIGPAGWDLYSGAGLIQMDAALAGVVPATPTPSVAGGATGIFQPLPSGLPTLLSSPTLTVTPVSSLLPATPTKATPPLLETSTPDTFISTPATIPPTPLSENKIKRLRVFLSPYFCGALLLISLAFWILRREKRERGREGRFHNKFVK